MLFTAIGFFACAALLGLYLLSLVLTNKNTPKGVALLHGLLAATGVILLIIYPFYYQPSPLLSLLLFILAAFGGLFLITRDLLGKHIPKLVAVGHGLLAVIAFITLIVFVVK